MSTLASLKLRNNLFTRWPDVLCSLPKLETLEFNLNPLTARPSCLGRLSTMKVLNLHSNKTRCIGMRFCTRDQCSGECDRQGRL